MKTFKEKVPEYGLSVKSKELLKAQIKESRAAYDFARQFYHEDLEIYESFFIMLMNRANNVIGWAKIAQGGLAACHVDIKLIAHYAIKALASSVILVHNHPSGNTRPSESDMAITRRIKEGLKVLEIPILDHIILGPGTADKPEGNFISFADEGLI